MPETAQRPYQTFTYTLTTADALVWRKLRTDWSKWEMLFGGALTVAVGLILAALPEAWIGVPYDPRFVAALALGLASGYGLFRLVIELNDRRIARRDIPAPRKVILEDWVDHLDERWEGGSRSVALEMMGPVLDTPGHVFIQGPGKVIIIPAAAFASASEKQTFVTVLEKLADEWAASLEAKVD